MAREYQSYPKILYAAGGQTARVTTEAEHRALGPEWYESPAEIPSVNEAPSEAPEESLPNVTTPWYGKRRGRPPKAAAVED